MSNPDNIKLSVEDICRGGTSGTRNPKMQDMLCMIGYGDNFFGAGFPVMVDMWQTAYGIKPVLFERYETDTVELIY